MAEALTVFLLSQTLSAPSLCLPVATATFDHRCCLVESNFDFSNLTLVVWVVLGRPLAPLAAVQGPVQPAQAIGHALAHHRDVEEDQRDAQAGARDGGHFARGRLRNLLIVAWGGGTRELQEKKNPK